MQNQRLASRYAKSLLDLASEKGSLEQTYKDMLYLQQVMRMSKDFTNLLRSPVVAGDKKQASIKAVIGSNVGELTLAFTQLLITKGREFELPEIITSFIQQYKTKKGIQILKLTTATPVSDEVKNALVQQVKKTGHFGDIEVETVVNPDIIGGFILQAGDKLVDASISYDLKEIGRQFENNDFIYKVR